MPSPAERAIPTLTVTRRQWWHVFAARGGGVNFRVTLGGDIRPPEAVCEETLNVPYWDEESGETGFPRVAVYITSFDHEPDTDEIEAIWPTEEEYDDDESVPDHTAESSIEERILAQE